MATEGRRKYTKADRAKALGIAIVKGQTAAADQMGIPLSTIHLWWKKPEYAELRTTAREDVVEQFRVAMQVGIAEVEKGLRSDAPLRDKAVAVSMLAEKFALFTGQATTRTETRDLTDTLDDTEREALRNAIDEYLRSAVPEEEPA